LRWRVWILQWIEKTFSIDRHAIHVPFLTIARWVDLLTVISILDFFLLKDQQAYVALFVITLIALFTSINYVQEKLKTQSTHEKQLNL